MIDRQAQWLLQATSSDFTGVARKELHQRSYRWVHIKGNQNERCWQMVMRSGKGLVGQVVRSGRHITLDASSPDWNRMRLYSPIMLSEHLYAAIVAPIEVETEVTGVLLVGSRSARTYEPSHIESVLKSASRIAAKWQHPSL